MVSKIRKKAIAQKCCRCIATNCKEGRSRSNRCLKYGELAITIEIHTVLYARKKRKVAPLEVASVLLILETIWLETDHEAVAIKPQPLPDTARCCSYTRRKLAGREQRMSRSDAGRLKFSQLRQMATYSHCNGRAQIATLLRQKTPVCMMLK